jgi:hypothetical protein
MKIQWTRPKLVIIERGEPAESVLLHCKTIGGSGNPTLQTQQGCDSLDLGTQNCGACQSRSGS